MDNHLDGRRGNHKGWSKQLNHIPATHWEERWRLSLESNGSIKCKQVKINCQGVHAASQGYIT